MVSQDFIDKDSTLVRDCKRELPYRTTAFEKLVRTYEPIVFKTCRFLLNDPDDAEEVSQDVFMRVFHYLQKFDEKSTFRTWLYRIVRNCCYTRIKQKERNTIFNRDILSNSGSSNDELENVNALSDQMEEALNKLTQDEREIITLRFISELSLKEISETLGSKLSATKMRFYRALDKLKVEFKP